MTIGSKVPRRRWRSRNTTGQAQSKPRILTLCNWVLLWRMREREREQFAGDPSWYIIVVLDATRRLYFTRAFPDRDWCFIRNSMRYKWLSGHPFLSSGCHHSKMLRWQPFSRSPSLSGIFPPALDACSLHMAIATVDAIRLSTGVIFTRAFRGQLRIFPTLSRLLGKIVIDREAEIKLLIR